MINKLALTTMVLIMATTVSLASGPQGVHEPGTGVTNPDIKEAAQGTGQGLQAVNETNVSAFTPGIHESGTGIINPEVKEAAQGIRQGNQMQAGQPAKESAIPAPKTQPGFEIVFAITSFIAVAFLAPRRKS
jgi:hypothetical protein